MAKKILVAVYSASGVTKRVGEEIAKICGGGFFEIVPKEIYTSDDLNWMNKNSRSSVEMKDESSRPAIGGEKIADISKYDTILLLAPIWWYQFPTIMNTFLESYDMAGKKIILFATSGGSGLGESAKLLQVSAPGAEIINGEMLNRIGSGDKIKQIVDKYI